MTQGTLKLVALGHVDHGKSTLIARLLAEAGAVADARLAAARAASERRGVPFEWAFLLDALQEERDQNVTLDVAQAEFIHSGRRYVLIDAPGHRQLLRSALTGAARADAALLVVDAAQGVGAQTKRHAQLAQLLGVRAFIVVVNKMDAVEYSEQVFSSIKSEAEEYFSSLGLLATGVIPVSARVGDMLRERGGRLAFYRGPTVMEALAALPSPAPDTGPLRLPVQDVYREEGRRVLVGRLESGRLSVGDRLVLSPSGARAVLREFIAWPDAPRAEAEAGESVAFVLEGEPLVRRGEVAHHEADMPRLTHLFCLRLMWLDDAPLAPGQRYTLRAGTQEVLAELREVKAVIDSEALRAAPADAVPRDAFAQAVFRARGPLALDEGSPVCVLSQGRMVGVGRALLDGFPDQRVRHDVKSAHLTSVAQTVTPEARAHANGHRGGVLWFTGLSGSGKTTLAQGVQQALFARGCQVFVLDGDNIRQGLCRDLGFSSEDRRENLRRAAEAAALFAQAGFIVIAAFISPTEEDRKAARAATSECFHTVYVDADLATCEARDTKGLYRRARQGEIAEFTGISSPYIPPAHPDITINTMEQDEEACIHQLLRYIEREMIDSLAEQ